MHDVHACDSIIHTVVLFCIFFLLFLQAYATVLCGGCNAEVAKMDDAFIMPGHSQCAKDHVNPYGYTHTTLTVKKLSDRATYKLEGEATTWHTWFQG